MFIDVTTTSSSNKSNNKKRDRSSMSQPPASIVSGSGDLPPSTVVVDPKSVGPISTPHVVGPLDGNERAKLPSYQASQWPSYMSNLAMRDKVNVVDIITVLVCKYCSIYIHTTYIHIFVLIINILMIVYVDVYTSYNVRLYE
jgi:hypothetical protein